MKFFWHWGKRSRTTDEEIFLEGPHSRGRELLSLLDITLELFRGFRKLHFIGPCVTVYGSARFEETHPHYITARELGSHLALAGFTVMTGGGPGIMEAANRGAMESGGCSIGCNITLPHEQKPNEYLHFWMEFKYFMIRKFMLAKYSYAFVAMPGGFGTLDELFSVLTLIQTGKMNNYPIVLMGTEYWGELRKLIEETLVREKAIKDTDVSLILYTDSAQEAAAFIESAAKERFSLKLTRLPKAIRLLGEKEVKGTDNQTGRPFHG